METKPTLPPPLPENDLRPQVAVVAIAIGIFVLLFVLALSLTAVPSGGPSADGTSSGGTGLAEDSGNGPGAAQGATPSAGANDGEAMSTLPASVEPPPTTVDVDASATTRAALPDPGTSTVASDKPESSATSRTYEFLAPRSGVASSSPQGDVGREADFFGIAAGGSRFVYVVDKSSSMTGARFEMARDELLSSMKKLKSNQSFFVLFYDDVAYPQPSKKLIPARSSNIRKISEWVKNATPKGGTSPMEAIEYAIAFEPDAIFVLSDGEFDQSVVHETTRLNEGSATRIHTIGFQNDAETLRAIAEQNGGTYRFVR